MCKSIISTEEVERCYTGNPRFFEWRYDETKLVDRGSNETKRFGGLYSPGDNNTNTVEGVPESYTCAEIVDPQVGSTSDIAATYDDICLFSKLKTTIINKIYDESDDITN